MNSDFIIIEIDGEKFFINLNHVSFIAYDYIVWVNGEHFKIGCLNCEKIKKRLKRGTLED